MKGPCQGSMQGVHEGLFTGWWFGKAKLDYNSAVFCTCERPMQHASDCFEGLVL